jgi:hypothetical protein
LISGVTRQSANQQNQQGELSIEYRRAHLRKKRGNVGNVENVGNVFV